MTPQAREQMEATARPGRALPVAQARAHDPGPGPIRCAFIGRKSPAWRDRAAIVYYHGGGHVIGNLDTHDFVARNLCAAEALIAWCYRMGPIQIPGGDR
jgi:acetyl esterase